MPSKRNQNPADSARRALKAKEKKRNKEARDKAREQRQAKADTSGITSEIASLQAQGDSLTTADKSRLKELKKELSYIDSSKEKARQAELAAQEASGSKVSSKYGAENTVASDTIHHFRKDGKLKNPKRSIYYDPVYNPYGVPPPGMPYKERCGSLCSNKLESRQVFNDCDPAMSPLEATNAASSSRSEEDSDVEEEDLEAVEGLAVEENSESETEIPMHHGQLKMIEGNEALMDFDMDIDDIPMPDGPCPPKGPVPPHAERPLLRLANGPLPGMPAPPPPPPGFRSSDHTPLPPGPPPASSLQGQPVFKPTFMQATESFNFVAPQRPQAVRPPVDMEQAQRNATISAEPQLRDLKKEATAFVPNTLKRKKGPQQNLSTAQIDSAGQASDTHANEDVLDDLEEPAAKRPSLLGSLKANGIVTD